MKRLLFATALLCALTGCAGSSTPGTHGTAPLTARGASPGPRAEDGFDDRALATLAADVTGRTGDDAARAHLRLLAAQTRAFVVAAVHALPGATGASAPDADAGARPAPRFDPPALLATQFGATEACRAGGSADACAAAMGNALLERLQTLAPPRDLLSVREGLLTALAILEPSRVPLATSVRWRVLHEGDDPGAHLAQALALATVSRYFAHAVDIACPCDEAAMLAGRLAAQLAIGECAEAYARVVEGAGEAPTGLAALAGGGCVPACARTALAGQGEDVVLEAARTCRGEPEPVAFSPFGEAARAVSAWARAARARLAARGNDPAVTAILASSGPLPTADLPLPPPLFLAADGTAVEVPPVPAGSVAGVAVGTAGALVWLPPAGDATVTAAPRFSLQPVPEVAPRRGPVDGLRTRVDEVLAAVGDRGPVALVVDRQTRAPRVVAALAALARASEGEPLVALAVRHGASARYVPLRVPAAAPATVLRVGERQITVVERGTATRVVALVPAPASGVDTLGGALPETPPAEPLAIAPEADLSGATLARVAAALAVHGARATPARLPAILPAVAEGALTFGALDPARATALRAAVDAHRAEAQRCLEGIAPSPELLAPRVDLLLVLDPRGRLMRVDARGDSARTEAAAQCVARAVRRWRLPTPGAQAEVHVAYVGDASAPATPPAARAF